MIDVDGTFYGTTLLDGGVTDVGTVFKVTKDGKETKYYLEKNEFFKDAHSGLKICTASKDSPIKVKVTGTVVKKDDKMTLTPTAKIEAAD